MSLVRLAVTCVAVGSVLASDVDAQRRELSPEQQAVHVLSRLGFGPRPGDVERVMATGVDKWIDEQLRPGTVADAETDRAIATFPAWTKPTNQLTAAAFRPTIRPTADMMIVDSATGRRSLKPAFEAELRSQLEFSVNPTSPYSAGKLMRAHMSERQLLEVLADFWENHFSVYSGKQSTREVVVDFSREVIRPNALGRFRLLLGEVAKSPAMLHYLDNRLSTRDGLNENYARELLELHTLGVDGGYSQNDVIAVARAFTGWTIRANGTRVAERTSAFDFRHDQHDGSEKAVLGHRLEAGRGIEDGEQVLDIVARHPSTARYISWKLARRFVSDSPPPALVERAAAVFLSTDGDIISVVRTIITSDEFFSNAAFRAKVKNPFEFVASARRALGARADSTSASWRTVRDLGQPMFGRATPDGWPEDGAAWINSGTILNRIMYAADLAADKVHGVALSSWSGWTLVDTTASAQADGVIRLILGGIATDETRRTLAAVDHESGEERLREMVAVAIGSPEFQRR